MSLLTIMHQTVPMHFPKLNSVPGVVSLLYGYAFQNVVRTIPGVVSLLLTNPLTDPCGAVQQYTG